MIGSLDCCGSEFGARKIQFLAQLPGATDGSAGMAGNLSENKDLAWVGVGLLSCFIG